MKKFPLKKAAYVLAVAVCALAAAFFHLRYPWNDAVLQEIASYPADQPRSIQVSGEVAQGKTTLRYEGYLTDAAGNRVDFRQERTFDFVLDRTPFAA